MTYITREDSIEFLSFSNRTYNCLRRNGIDTIGQVLDFPAEEWKKLPNLGAKSVSELLGVLEEIRTGSSRFSLVACRSLPTATELIPTAPLPEKPVMLTFDDGYETFYAYAYPLLQKYQAKAVLSIHWEHPARRFSPSTKKLSISI